LSDYQDPFDIYDLQEEWKMKMITMPPKMVTAFVILFADLVVMVFTAAVVTMFMIIVVAAAILINEVDC
jgi:hypothetical protein